MKKCLSYSLTMSLVSCFILFITSSTIVKYYLHDKISPVSLRILACSLPFLSLSSCINGYFSALRKVKKNVYAQVLGEFLKIIFISFLLNYFLPSGIEYACISLVLGSTISEFLSFLFLAFLYFKDQRKLTYSNYRNTNYTKQILKIALPISFTSYIRSGLSSFKQLIIPSRLEKFGLSSDVAFSNYGVINGIVMPLILFPCSFISSFSSLLIPEFSYMIAKKEIDKLHFSLEKILKFSFLFSFFIMGFFWCFSNELNIFIYPNIEVSYYIRLLSPLIILIYIDNIVDSILKGLNKQVHVMGINILDLVSSILLIYFLLPIQGIKGYIIVLFISEILNGLVSLFLLIKETGLKVDFANWVIKPCFAVFLLNFLFRNYSPNSILELIFQILIFCICYFATIVLLKGLVKSDLKF